MAEGSRSPGRRLALPLLAGVLVAGSLVVALIDSLGSERAPREKPAPVRAAPPPAEPPELPRFIEEPDDGPDIAPEVVEGEPADEPAEPREPADPEPVGEGIDTPAPTRAERVQRMRVERRRQAAEQLAAGAPDGAIRLLTRGGSDAADREAAQAIRRLKASGTVNTYVGVLKALRWLVAHQDPKTGGLHNRTYGKVCGDDACRSQWSPAYDPGISGLVLIALTAFKPLDLAQEFEEPAARLTEYLVRLVDGRGTIAAGTNYNEAIVALALLESRAWEGQERYLRVAARLKAGRLVSYLAGPAQIADGGWRYRPDEFASDSSVTCWVLQALIEAQSAGIKNLAGDIQDGLAFLDYCTDGQGWTGYRDNRSRNPRLTAAAMYVRLLADVPPASPRVAGANRMLLATVEQFKRNLRGGRKNAAAVLEKQGLLGYGAYYLLNAAGRLGDDKWRAWGVLHRGAILGTQESKGHLAGSWAPATRWAKRAGRLYYTAMQALALLAK